jgi:hypothetical protein
VHRGAPQILLRSSPRVCVCGPPKGKQGGPGAARGQAASGKQEHANADMGGQPNKQPNGKHLALGAYVAAKLGPENAHGRHICILKLGEVPVSMRIIEVAVSRRRRLMCDVQCYPEQAQVRH